MIIKEEITSIPLPNAIDTFVINVLLSNNGGEFNNISSLKFGKN